MQVSPSCICLQWQKTMKLVRKILRKLDDVLGLSHFLSSCNLTAARDKKRFTTPLLIWRRSLPEMFLQTLRSKSCVLRIPMEILIKRSANRKKAFEARIQWNCRCFTGSGEKSNLLCKGPTYEFNVKLVWFMWIGQAIETNASIFALPSFSFSVVEEPRN